MTKGDQDTIVYAQIEDAERKKFHVNGTYLTLFGLSSDSDVPLISRAP